MVEGNMGCNAKLSISGYVDTIALMGRYLMSNDGFVIRMNRDLCAD